MEKQYSKSEVEMIMQKIFLDGKIKTHEFYLSYLERQINEANETFQYYDKTHKFGFATSPDWHAASSTLSTLVKVKTEMERMLIKLNKQREKLDSNHRN